MSNDELWEHPNDNRRGSNAKGMKAEEAFDIYFEREGFVSQKVSTRINKTEHIDRMVIRKDRSACSFQIKSPKEPIFYNNHQNKLEPVFPIELHNEYKNLRGWMYDGKSNSVAFAYKRNSKAPFYFMIVKRTDLVDLVAKVMKERELELFPDRTEEELKPGPNGWQKCRGNKLPYCLYNRRDFELLLYIPFSELKSIGKLVLTDKKLIEV